MSELTITEFLEARIAEDEAAARAATGSPWTYADVDSIGGGTLYDREVAIAGMQWDNTPVDPRIRRTRTVIEADANGAHIVRHDPARALAECAAKRAIIKLADDVELMDTQISNEWGGPNDGTADDILRALAAVYADHPDYRKEWAL